MNTSVANIRDIPGLEISNGIIIAPAKHVYIGRANRSRGLSASPLANPFPVHRESERGSSIEKYIRHLYAHPDLCAEARALKDKVLVCWCAPKKCHGSIVAAIADAECDCCHMPGVYNGLGSGPTIFRCRESCTCHD